MALACYLILWQALYTCILGNPVNTPFEVYGLPPEGYTILPENRENNPQNQHVSKPHRAPEFIYIPTNGSKPNNISTQENKKQPNQVVSHKRNKPNQPSSVNLPDETTSPKYLGDKTVLPENQPKVIIIQDKSGQYSFGVSQPGPEGQTIKEQGRLISTNDGWEYVIAKRGSYAYTSPEGVPIMVEWEADHNGFRILKSTV